MCDPFRTPYHTAANVTLVGDENPILSSETSWIHGSLQAPALLKDCLAVRYMIQYDIRTEQCLCQEMSQTNLALTAGPSRKP